MKELLYYPGFEIKDKQWLKFALLYLDHISPIIPRMCVPEEEYLSREFLQVKNGSDLICIKEPSYRDTCYASDMAIRQMGQYLDVLYYDCDRGPGKKAKDLRYWQRPENHDYQLYAGKYDWKFMRYCEENHFATENKYGLLLPKEIAEYYMGCLAEVISEHENIEMITDSAEMEEQRIEEIRQRRENGTFAHVEIAKSELQMAMPLRLENIPLERILELRRTPAFERQRKAYIDTLDHVIKMRTEGKPDYSMEQELDLKREYLFRAFNGLGTLMYATNIVLSVKSLILTRKTPDVADMVNLAGSGDGLWNRGKALKSGTERIQRKKLANRYIVSMKRLNQTKNM